MKKQKNNLSIFTIAALIIIFVGPIITAYWMVNSDLNSGMTKNNYGTFIEPSFEIKEKAEKKLLKEISLKPGEWLGLLFYKGTCDKACTEDFQLLETVRSVIGRDAPRLNFKILAASNSTNREDVVEDGASLNNLVLKLSTTIPNIGRIERGLVIVDWRSRVMLFYPSLEPKGIKKDLGRLLRGSRIR